MCPITVPPICSLCCEHMEQSLLCCTTISSASRKKVKAVVCCEVLASAVALPCCLSPSQAK